MVCVCSTVHAGCGGQACGRPCVGRVAQASAQRKPRVSGHRAATSHSYAPAFLCAGLPVCLSRVFSTTPTALPFPVCPCRHPSGGRGDGGVALRRVPALPLSGGGPAAAAAGAGGARQPGAVGHRHRPHGQVGGGRQGGRQAGKVEWSASARGMYAAGAAQSTRPTSLRREPQTRTPGTQLPFDCHLNSHAHTHAHNDYL